MKMHRPLALASIVALAHAATSLAGQVTVEPSGFVATIDNPYMPLRPGTTLVYETPGADARVVVVVTCETRVVQGVTCTVVDDRAYVGGVLEESTRDWFAQDTDGNVWYFGEETAELDADGNVVSTAGSWEAGVDGAEAGIVMLAQNRPGQWYQQEYYEGEAEDRAKVLRLSAPVTVPAGQFEGCLETKEWTPLTRGQVEHKFYAPGTGLVLVESLTGGPIEREELVSVSFRPCP